DRGSFMTQRPTETRQTESENRTADPADESRSADALAGDEEAAVAAAETGPAATGGERPAASGDGPEELAAVEHELAEALRQVEAERDEYLDRLQRAQAEFANYRKRIMREGAAQREQGAADVLAKLLDVVDDLELAVLAAQVAPTAGEGPHGTANDPDGLRKGVEMVYGKLIDVLRSFGLEKIGQEDVPFDPVLHEAVQTVDDDQEREQPVVAEILRPGYLLGGRVLRPAMVKVLR
ncbi:MAG: nucleotide exchange factor GrpE, partial [Actinomycetota bacterium]|nr:nucleotide exchange factor GrpE [Actinomycetota bacterium]